MVKETFVPEEGLLCLFLQLETILLKFTLKKSKLRKEMHCLKLFLLGKERKKTELEYKHTVCMVYPQ